MPFEIELVIIIQILSRPNFSLFNSITAVNKIRIVQITVKNREMRFLRFFAFPTTAV